MKKERLNFSLAILVDPIEEEPPSGKEAIEYLLMKCPIRGVRPIVGTYDELKGLDYDALFIRQGTAIGNKAHLLSMAAAKAGIPVIDDPTSIEASCNKIAMMHRFRIHKVPTPRSLSLSVHFKIEEIKNILVSFDYPIVVKDPTTSFSRGVHKADNEDQLIELIQKLRITTPTGIVQIQEFLPTRFDWRIGVLNRRPIYCCQYNMAPGHWQVIKNLPDGSYIDGGSVTLPPSCWPQHICSLAVKAARTIGNGLYGVDIKERGDRLVVIEVNDNPTIDHGDEDKYGGVWEGIIEHFRRLVEARTRRVSHAPHTTSSVAVCR